MFANTVVRDFPTDQRVPHFPRAIPNAVRRRNRIFRLDEAHRELALALAQACPQAFVDRLDLPLDANIALAVALIPDHSNGRRVNEVEIGAKLPCNAIRLGVTAGVLIDKDGLGIGQSR
jgi:hypothetical protein